MYVFYLGTGQCHADSAVCHDQRSLLIILPAPIPVGIGQDFGESLFQRLEGVRAASTVLTKCGITRRGRSACGSSPPRLEPKHSLLPAALEFAERLAHEL